ncbi:uncharacterized protein LOC113272225 [Papaver somniferum]|uniref:uncharacterized protein LOC113272225 n=1 Tax=Papaver somniferum TaxID=3469 RepID=UPI000E6FA02B|nr:uncharacterized protein LOC113272225 [Papaver somniferum]
MGSVISCKVSAEYFFWDYQVKQGDSNTWKDMIAVRNIFTNNCCWFIRFGDNIQIWNDPWIPNLPGFRPTMLQNSIIQVTWVSELFVQGQKIWNVELLLELFPLDQAEIISQIYIPQEEEVQDKLIWIKTPSGKFTTKSCYKLLSDNNLTTSSMAEFPWKQFWKKNVCPLCNLAEESIFHLFFSCQFDLEVFQNSPILIETHGETVMEVISHWLAYPDQGIIPNLGSCLMWNIWKIRNDLVFNNNHTAVGICIHKALEDFECLDLHHALNYCSEIQVNQNNFAAWELQSSTFVKTNVDATYNNGKGAVAAVAVDFFGNHLGCGAICFDTFSAAMAEAKAYGFGIQLARRLQLPRVIVEVDASEIPKAVTGNTNEIPWSIRSTVLSIRDRIKDFSEIKFVVIPRDANSITHDLIQYAISNYINKWWYHDESPNFIMQRLTFSEE